MLVPALIRYLHPSLLELTNIQVIITDKIKPKRQQSYKRNLSFLQSVLTLEDKEIITQSPKLLSILNTLPLTYFNDKKIIKIIVKLKEIIDNINTADVLLSYEWLFINLLMKKEFKNIIYKLYPSYKCWNIPEEYSNYYQNGQIQLFHNNDCI